MNVFFLLVLNTLTNCFHEVCQQHSVGQVQLQIFNDFLRLRFVQVMIRPIGVHLEPVHNDDFYLVTHLPSIMFIDVTKHHFTTPKQKNTLCMPREV